MSGERKKKERIVQKLLKGIKKMQQGKEKKIDQNTLDTTDSESENAPYDLRSLPSNQCHIAYSKHSRAHFKPTPMHLVEFVDQSEDTDDKDRISLAVHEGIFAVCSCDPNGDKYDRTITLYPTIPVLKDGEHFLGGPTASIALTSIGILYSALSPEDWTSQLKTYLGISDLFSEMEQLNDIRASLIDEIAGHHQRFWPNLSPAASRKTNWTDIEEEEDDRSSYYEEEREIRPPRVPPHEETRSQRYAFPPSRMTTEQRREVQDYRDPLHHVDAVRSNYRPTIANITPINPNTLPWNLLPEYDHLLLDMDIPADQWAIHDLHLREENHGFVTTRPLSRGEVRTLTIHHNFGQNLYMSPTTIEDTLDMARKGWAYPNLSYRETMTMLHEIKCPEILGKELDNCVVAWKEARKVQNMFIQTSANQDSPKYTSETEFFKHHLAVKYVNQHAPVLDRPLKEISPATLEKHLKNCMKHGIEHSLHYKLWIILYGASPHMKLYDEKVKREAETYPKYDQILYHLASFWAMTLRSYVNQDINYEAKKGEYLDKVKTQVLKGEIANAIVELKSEAAILKTYNPNYATDAVRGGMTEDMQRKGTEREIRTALLELLAYKDAPLEHVWQEMVQSHLRENPSAVNRGESHVKNLPIEELINRFKNACEMIGFQEKAKKTHPPGIFNSKVTPSKESKTYNRNKKCDKCKILRTPCSPDLHHCKEIGHQDGQDITDSSTNSFYTRHNCLHCLKQLQRNIHKAQQKPTPTPQQPPSDQKKEKCDKCKHLNKPCLARFNHCELPGHQRNQPQDDKTISTWNKRDSCPFCSKKETRKTHNNNFKPKSSHLINSIVDEPIPFLPTLPMIPNRPDIRHKVPIHPNKNAKFSQNKPTLPIAPFLNNPAPPMAPFQPKPKPTPRITPYRPQGTQPFSKNTRF